MARAMFKLIRVEFFIICLLLGGTESHRYCACLFSKETPSFPQSCEEKEIMAVDSAFISHSQNCVLGGGNIQNCNCSCPIEDDPTRPQSLVELLKECEGIPIKRCLRILNYIDLGRTLNKTNFITIDYSCLPKPKRFCSCVKSGGYEDFLNTCAVDSVVAITHALVLNGLEGLPTLSCVESTVKRLCDQFNQLLTRSWLKSFTRACTGETPANCQKSLRNTKVTPVEIRGDRYVPSSFLIEYRCLHIPDMMDMCSHSAKNRLNTSSTYISSPGYPDTMSSDYGSCQCDVTSATDKIVQVRRSAVQFQVADDSCVEVTTQGTRGSCIKSQKSTENVQTPFSITFTGNGKNDNRFLFYVQGRGRINIQCKRLDDKNDKASTGILAAIIVASAVCVLILGAFIIFYCLRRKRSKQSANSTSAISKHANTATVETPESTSAKSHSNNLSHQTTAVDNVYHSKPEAAAGITADRDTAEGVALDDIHVDGGHQMEKSDFPQQDNDDTNEENDTILVENDVYEGHSDLLRPGGGSDEDPENDVYHRHHEDPGSYPGAAPAPDSDDDSIFIENDVYERAGDAGPVGD